MDRDWEKYRGGPTPSSRDVMHVTLNRKGLIYLNANAYRLLGRPTGVYLYYNRNKDQIALEPASPRLPETFPVKELNKGFLIHASPFCRHFGVRLDTTEKFIRPDIDEKGVLRLDLSSTVTVSGIKRARKRR
jgi:hypothetical protein